MNKAHLELEVREMIKVKVWSQKDIQITDNIRESST